MKKKFKLYIRSFWSLIHIAFTKLFHPKGIYSALAQDLSPSAALMIRNGGKIRLDKHIHTRRGVTFEADGGEIKIGEGCFFGSGCTAASRESITIGSYTAFGPNVMIYDHDHDMDGFSLRDERYKTAPIEIGNGVWVGANSVILRGTSLGDGCVIGAGSIVKGIYEAGSVIVQKRSETVKRTVKKEEITEGKESVTV